MPYLILSLKEGERKGKILLIWAYIRPSSWFNIQQRTRRPNRCPESKDYLNQIRKYEMPTSKQAIMNQSYIPDHQLNAITQMNRTPTMIIRPLQCLQGLLTLSISPWCLHL